jgi:FkbM family methyltransferase
MAAGWSRRAIVFIEDCLTFGPGVIRPYLGRLLNHSHFVAVRSPNVGTIYIRPNQSDLASFRQAFVEGQYDLTSTGQGDRLSRYYNHLLATGTLPIIIDAGANVGAGAIWFSKTFPEAKIFALEPEPTNAEICRRNLASARNIVLLEGAIAGRPGFVKIKNAGASWAAQTIRSEEKNGVRIHTITDVLTMAGKPSALFIVKIDIEGFEADLFAHDTGWISQTACIFIEPHDWLFPGRKTSRTMQGALFDAGFEMLLRGENLVFVRDQEDLRVPVPPPD